ncbi:FMN-dependent NADH-azoreductase [Capsulimonas corticalis]|nr:FMN-dependent NADH-azoreductase [Capsulimonas corticalis]
MTNILLVTSSPRGEDSLSTQTARVFADKLQAAHTGATLTKRDVNADPSPHLAESLVHAIRRPAADRTPEDIAALAHSDSLVGELQAADIIVLASGMINFGVPSALKSWIDHIARSGVTFRYGPDGAEGLLKGKKLYLVLAYGGVYAEGPAQAMNFQEPYLKTLLGFLGLTDVEVVTIEGVAYGPEMAQKAVAAANERVDALVAASAR